MTRRQKALLKLTKRRRIMDALAVYRDSKRNPDKRARHLQDRKEAGYV